MRARLGGAALTAITIAACSFDWDAYDPRLGGDAIDASAGYAGDVGGGGAAANAGTAAVSGAGGSNGGSAGSGGASASGGAAGEAGSGGTAATGGASGSAGAAGASGGSGGSSGSGGADGGAGGAGGAVVSTATYAPPSVAECISVVAPDPAACEATSGTGQISVDGQNAGLPGAPATAAFLSFVLDNAFAGKQVVSVKLELTVANEVNAASDKSGEVWAVEPFTLADLSNKVPAKQGTQPLGADVGPVTPLQVVDWTLPTSSVTAGQSVYFGVFPTSTNGVDYYGRVSPAPPKLIVAYQ